MGSVSIVHWGIVLVAAFLVLGRSKFSSLMGQFGQGLKSFRKGLVEDPAIYLAEPSDAVAEPFVDSNQSYADKPIPY